MNDVRCPALMVAAVASGQGKTTLTAALARYHRNQGRRVRVFKTGPDYLDPQILAAASGEPVEPLDLWMAGENYCRDQLYRAAQEADIILVEGAMGLFDGDSSSADLAAVLGLAVAVLIDGKGMAQTAAAVALGMARFRPELNIAGIVANRVASERHRRLIADSLPADLPLLAHLPRDESIGLPERHLGLVHPAEQPDLGTRLDRAAAMLTGSPVAALPPSPSFKPAFTAPLAKKLDGVRIAIARDGAFSFIYAANLRLLEGLGASLTFFSPLDDHKLPPADAFWLPGGYPELHAQHLAANTAMKAALRNVHALGKPILAECGGMLYLQETLTDYGGQPHPMAGLLPGHGEMRSKRGCQGMQTAPLPEGDLRGHAHHHSRSHATLAPLVMTRRQRHSAPGEAVVRRGRLTASYLHFFFLSNPSAVARLLAPEAAHESPVAHVVGKR